MTLTRGKKVKNIFHDVCVCMYRGHPSWRCPWDRVFQLGLGEGPIGIVGPMSQPRGTIDTASRTLVHTCTLGVLSVTS